MKLDFMRIFRKVKDIGTEYGTNFSPALKYSEVRYLVPILHSVKLTKCEICGSVKPIVPRFQKCY